ncbi:tripartite tricarboxylate transporter substrate binding protein [Bordetella sp. BOR01]|uniref:Bug family tripartite tricarboxylate transporter substrate binding protein n=1 Tax=Bordetella sp. BOR01 TaxID=2854779 RepID=UPI001C482FF1|nr:tripartite tricarboxylate transporter substrate binding protein [Bordetella sp. BOR01]MBV7483484.1 tripartite tricarboxylate transporter substrate binding protein [Bordetella sp. BOR01]
MKTKLIAGLATLLAALSTPWSAAAQDYPNRPITIIVPYTPGDGPDVIARLVGAEIGQRMGQSVVIENKAGASGQIGLTLTAKAPPDGYTLGVGLVTNLALASHTYKDLPYDPLKDFTPVALATMNYLALVSRPDAPFKTVPEMIAWAKANPGKLQIGTTSMGGLPHMSFELLAHMSGIKFMNVPYKGNGPIAADLTGGRIDLGVTSYTSSAPLIEAGRLNLLGITYPSRDPKLPQLPTIGESVKGYSSVGWFGFVAPAGTPPEIVDKLNAEINRALQQPNLQKTMSTLGLIPVTESPEYFARLLKSENEKFGKLVSEIGYQPQ